MAIDHPELGPILYTHGNEHVCDRGVCDKKTSIFWDDIDTLFLVSTSVILNFTAQMNERLELQVISKTGDGISLGRFGFIAIRKKHKENFWNIYEFIVSKVIDRQFSDLLTDLKEGTRVSFESFDVTSSQLYRRTLFGDYDIIDLHRILASGFISGELFIDFSNDKGRRKRKSLGRLSVIPNVHLARTFLSCVARRNSSQ